MGALAPCAGAYLSAMSADDRILVRRAGPLHGEVDVPGAKNSVLKLMAATLLADGEFTLTNVPDIADVSIMSDLLAAIGVSSTREAVGVLRMVNGGDSYERALPAELYVDFVDEYRRQLLRAIGDSAPYFYPFRRILFWGRKPG